MRGWRWPQFVLVVALVAGLLVGGVGAQGEGDQPEWADGLFERIEAAAERYNAAVPEQETGPVERWLLRNAKANLYVEDADGETAVFSFRTDGHLRVTQLRRGGYEDPTLRVSTSRAALDRIADADDVHAAVDREVRRGAIRVQRVVELFPWLVVVVSAREVVAGVGAAALVGLGVAKLGVEGLLSFLWGLVQQLVSAVTSAVRSVLQHMGGIATGLTILQQLGLLEQVKEFFAEVWHTVRTTVAGVVGRLRTPLRSDHDEDSEDR